MQVKLRMAAAERWSPALAVLSLASLAALYVFPFLKTAPNRLLSGEPVFLMDLLRAGFAPQTPSTSVTWLAAVLVALLLVSLLLACCRPRRRLLRTHAFVAALSWPALLAVAALQSTFVAQTASPLARTSPGSAFWLVAVMTGLMVADALQRARTGLLLRALVLAVITLPILLMLSMGWCDDLSIMKEYANRSDVFASVVLRHVQIVGVSLLLTLAIGLPLGWAAHHYATVGGAMFPVLGIIQTIPSIALFGLLMAPLAFMAAAWPALSQAGISGVGLAPGVLALVLYSLLPVVRGMVAGLGAVPSSVLEAAKGLGMPRGVQFWQVEMPLALPVVLGGVRTAAVQAVGLAAVTALIGAGGLGSIMFEGLFSNAQDLVLLGVLPIIAMGVAVDLMLKALMAWARLHGQQAEEGGLDAGADRAVFARGFQRQLPEGSAP